MYKGMIKTGVIIALLAVLSGCATERMRARICNSCPTQTVTEQKDSLVLRDTTIYIPADSSFYYAWLMCKDGKVEIDKVLAEINGRVVRKPTVKIKDNKLTVICPVDSHAVAIQWYERHRHLFMQESRYVIPEKPTFFESVAWLLFAITVGIIGMMLLYWALFKKKGSG
jgi:hypothetical protein